MKRYLHNYERYKNHERSLGYARTLIKDLPAKINAFRDVSHTPAVEMEFMTEAAQTVIDCRLTLKWSYAYAYFMEDDGKLDTNALKLFQFRQSDLERYCEHLTGMVESPLDQYIDLQSKHFDHKLFQEAKIKFHDFRGAMIDYRRATESFRKKFLDVV